MRDWSAVPVAEPVAEPAPEPVAEAVAAPAPASTEDSPATDAGRRRVALPRRVMRHRATRRLLGLIAAVALLALGGFLGRFTAPDAATSSSEPPPLVDGQVESVTNDSDGSHLTVLTGRGRLVVFVATTATVATPQPGGLNTLRPGEHVVVDSHIDQKGSLAATTVLAGGGS